MSIFSHLVGKIPLVGHALNQVGKVLPSGGQLVGGLAGPIGGLIGGSLDPNTTSLQKKIMLGDLALGAGAGGLGALGGAGGIGGAISGAAGHVPGLGALVGGAGKLLGGGGSGGIGLGNLVDMGLGGAQAVNAANLANKSNQYATNAFNSVNDAYNSRAPLRTAGVQGMLNPHPGVDLSALQGSAGAGNPFARKPIALGNLGQQTQQPPPITGQA